MKFFRVAILSIYIISIISCNGNLNKELKYSPNNALDRDFLNGLVQEITTYKFYDSEPKHFTEKKSYTDWGEVETIIRFDLSGNIKYSIKNYYNDKKQMQTQKIFDISSGNYTTTNTFDINGKVISSTIDDGNNEKPNLKTTLFYNDDGDLIKMINHRENVIDTIEISYIYNDLDQLIEREQKNITSDHENISINRYSYDKNNNLIKIISENDFFGTMITEFKYDLLNRRKQKTTYNNQEIEKKIYFNSNYHPVKILYFKQGILTHSNKIKYNYDNQNNWTTKETYLKGSDESRYDLVETIERQIIYYQ